MGLTTLDIEVAVIKHLNPRSKVIVPNVSWGMYLLNRVLHECDLLVLTNSGYLWEIEIKTSKQDLIADKKKAHGHRHPALRRLYFAIPGYLIDCSAHIPDRAGIIVVDEYLRCDVVRKPKQMPGYRVNDTERMQIMRLGVMRVWGLKEKLRAVQTPPSGRELAEKHGVKPTSDEELLADIEGLGEL